MVKHSLLNLPTDFHPALPFQSRSLLYTFQQCCKVYVADVVALVVETVTEQVNSAIADEDIALRAQANGRKNALNLWRKHDHPLAYGENAYSLLLKAVTTDPNALAHGLPLSNHGQKSLIWFAEQVFAAATSNASRTIPPFWKHGRALSLFKMAFQEAERILAAPLDNPESRSTVTQLIAKAASATRICNIPWSPNHTGFAGRPSTTVTTTTWINLGHASPIPRVLHQNNEADILNNATEQALANDTQAQWSTAGLSIQDLHTILNRQVLPDEWDIDAMTWPSGSKAAYVHNTYIWVRDTFDATLPLHQVAILTSIIFSKLLPNICHNIPTPSGSASHNVTNIVRNAPWVPTSATCRKGMKQSIPFVIMMTTFIIAIYEHTSPLRKYMRKHSNSLGSPWTKKHSL